MLGEKAAWEVNEHLWRVCVNIPQPAAGRDRPPGSPWGAGARREQRSPCPGEGRRKGSFTQPPWPRRQWRLTSRATHPQLVHCAQRQSVRGPRRRCGEGTGVWVSFCSAVCCLVRKRVVGFCLKMLNSRLPWFSQAFSFLGSSGNLPRGSAMASPPPQGVLVLGARAPRQTGASLCGKRRGREGSCRRPSHRGSGLCTPVAGGRRPPRGPEAVASCRPSPCSPRSAVCRPCRASCLSPRLPSASSPVAQTGPSGGDCGFRPGGPAVSRGPRLSASPRVATARAARLGGGKAAG